MIGLTSPGCGGRGAGFFDVDETLVNTKTMFSFLRFYLELRGELPGTYDVTVRHLHDAAAAGTSRAQVNRLYYQLYRGELVADLESAGRRWADETLIEDCWLPARCHLDAFRKAGAFTALLSGSFFACLDPIAERLQVDAAHGTEVVVRRGVLTGEVIEPMIGARKAEQLTRLCAENGIAVEQAVAYGDHVSDLPMLCAAGHAVVVGHDPDLAAVAATRGWARLSGPAQLAFA